MPERVTPTGPFLLPVGCVATITRQSTPSGPTGIGGAVVQAAHESTFGTLLELIGRQEQTRLDQGMIKGCVLLATGHKSEPSQIGEHGSRPILAVKEYT